MTEWAGIMFWIAGGISGLLSLFGFAKIVELLTARKLSKKDAQEQAHISVAGKRIDAETDFRRDLIGRIEKLETRIEKLEAQNMTLTTTNATLKLKNEHLEEENRRQASEIIELRRQIAELQRIIGDLKDRITGKNGDAETAKLLEDAQNAERIALRNKPKWEPKETVSVLVVDDDEDTRQLLQLALEKCGLDSITCEHATDALRWLGENEARAIITDLAMAPLDGLTLVSQIRLGESSFAARNPAQIAFYTGHRPDLIVASTQEKHRVRKVFIKGKDDPHAVAKEIKGWF